VAAAIYRNATSSVRPSSLYLLTMRRVLPFVVAIYFIANLIKITVTQDGPGSIAEGLADSAFQLIPVIFVWLGVMTIIFAILERTYGKFGKALNLDNWNPTSSHP